MALNWSFLKNFTEPRAVKKLNDFLISVASKAVIGPKTNTADKFPQWDGANSRTLKDGYTLSTLAIAVGNLLMPVGTIYGNETDSRNPNVILGFGTWTQIKDKFILAAGDTYTAGATGGEATHTLTTAEIPNLKIPLAYGGTIGANGFDDAAARMANQTQTDNTNFSTSGGGGGAHNNMPPYEVGYLWKRTA